MLAERGERDLIVIANLTKVCGDADSFWRFERGFYAYGLTDYEKYLAANLARMHGPLRFSMVTMTVLVHGA